MRVVLDTNIVISGLLWRGAPNVLIESRVALGFRLFTSAPLIAELIDVLGRPKLEERIHSGGVAKTELVREYLRLVTVVKPIHLSAIAPDPDDDVVIATAISAAAELVVTGDLGLLSVGEYKGVRMVHTMEALQILRLR